MANAFSMYQEGNRLLYSNAGSALVAGNIVAIATGTSGFCGICIEDIAATTGTGTVAIGGGEERVWEGPKTSGEAWTQGQVLYWDGTALSSTSTSTSTRAGRAAYAAASAATTGYLILNAP